MKSGFSPTPPSTKVFEGGFVEVWSKKRRVGPHVEHFNLPLSFLCASLRGRKEWEKPMRDILAGEEDGKFNIHSGSRDPRARLLSNFAARPFSYLGRWFGSTEGFIQGIKFPEGDDRRKRAFVSSGEHAKRLGVGAKREFAWWNGQIIPYGSDDHQSLIVEAIECKFTQNPDCRTALMETHGLELVHETGTAESATTSLPAKRFCEILTKIRDRGRSGSARFAHRSLEAFVGRTGCLDSGRGGPFGYEP